MQESPKAPSSLPSGAGAGPSALTATISVPASQAPWTLTAEHLSPLIIKGFILLLLAYALIDQLRRLARAGLEPPRFDSHWGGLGGGLGGWRINHSLMHVLLIALLVIGIVGFGVLAVAPGDSQTDKHHVTAESQSDVKGKADPHPALATTTPSE